MITIQINRDGTVTGDTSVVAAYDNERFSKPIRILHPDFPHAVHKLTYRQGRAVTTDVISRDDLMRFIVNGPGIVRCQYVAEDARTGDTILVSSPFRLDVAKGFKNPSGEDPAHRLHTPDIIEMDLKAISDRLKEVGIITKTQDFQPYDFNLLDEDAEYYAGPDSKHTPEGDGLSESRYVVRVRVVNSYAFQTAYMIHQYESSIYYRTGIKHSGDRVVWNNWKPVLSNNIPTVSETDDVDNAPFVPGQYLVVRQADGTYLLYFDLPSGTSEKDRVLISSSGKSGNGAYNFSAKVENSTFTVVSTDVETPFDGMMCTITTDNVNDGINTCSINFNGTSADVYARCADGTIQPVISSLIAANVPAIYLYSNGKWITDAVVEGYEKLNNKVSDIVDADDTKYPTVAAVKSYVDKKVEENQSVVTNSVLTSNAPSSVRDFIKCALTYVTNSNRLTLGSEYTSLDETCTDQIDAAALVELCLRGVDFYNSRYMRQANFLNYKYAAKLPDSDNDRFNADELFSKAASVGCVFSVNRWSDMLPGDIAYWKKDNSKLNAQLAILIDTESHLAGLSGEVSVISTSEKAGDVVTLSNLLEDDLPDYAIRYPLQFVNELDYVNIVTNGEDILSGSGTGILGTYTLDSPMKKETPYTMSFNLSAPKGCVLRLSIQGNTSSYSTQFQTDREYSDEDISFTFCNAMKQDGYAITIVKNSPSMFVALTAASLYEGTIQTYYTEPMSDRQASTTSVYRYD